MRFRKLSWTIGYPLPLKDIRSNWQCPHKLWHILEYIPFSYITEYFFAFLHITYEMQFCFRGTGRGMMHSPQSRIGLIWMSLIMDTLECRWSIVHISTSSKSVMIRFVQSYDLLHVVEVSEIPQTGKTSQLNFMSTLASLETWFCLAFCLVQFVVTYIHVCTYII